MRNGNDQNSSSSSLDFDFALGLSTETSSSTYSSSCKRAASAMAFSNYYNSSTNNIDSNSPTGFPGGTMLNQVLGDASNNIYQQQPTHDDDTAVLPMTFLSTTAFRPPSGEVMYGKPPYFCDSQFQELERQKIIHKYMMASMPVPPRLILPPPVPSTPTTTTTVAQSTSSSGLELRFPAGGGGDPEPWRCKRTDGKKWRCSRDVAPDQKYCERHAHKSRTRSRKPVELSSHNKLYNTNKTSTTSTNAQTLLQRPTTTSSLFPTMASGSVAAAAPTSYNDQTRSFKWFLRGGSDANQQQQWQQQVISTPSSSTTTLDFTRVINNVDHDHNPNASSSVYDPYIPDTNFNNSQTTRHFIDAWEKEGGLDDISNKSSNKKFSSSSLLSLSMFGNGIDEENGHNYLGIGMLNNTSPNMKQQQPAPWMNMNSVSWINNNDDDTNSIRMSPPGGPLGEALCLGNSGMTTTTTTTPGHGYSQNNNSNNTTNSSSCSKSSCEDGNQQQQHALNFIG